jgi:hypothetical protein
MQPSLAQRLAVTSHPQDEKSKAQRRHEDHEDERKKGKLVNPPFEPP